MSVYLFGAGGRTRTPDLLITNQLLYQLSYTSKYFVSLNNITQAFLCVKKKFALVFILIFLI